MQADGMKKTLIVALGVSLVCSIIVSAAAVSLSGIQSQNRKIDRLKNILQAGDLYQPGVDVQAIYEERIVPKLVDLSTGEIVPDDQIPDELAPTAYSIPKVAGSTEFGVAIPADQDPPGIKRKPKFMYIYQVNNAAGEMEKLIFPIFGKGLWSTMYGFLALDRDLKTIRGITFYEHGETPGLGGEVDNPRWKESWKGKTAFNDQNDIIIEVIKGQVDPGSPQANHQIDGLSGSTITTRGVDNTIEYWLGEYGYGEYLNKLRQEGANG